MTVTWIVLADGAKAKIFENTGSSSGLERVDYDQFMRDPKKDHELISDRHGQTADNNSPRPHRYEPHVGPEELEERRFAKNLVQFLDEAHQRNRFEQLIIMAEPQTLNDMRTAVSKTLEPAIIKQVAKNLVSEPEDELYHHLSEYLDYDPKSGGQPEKRYTYNMAGGNR